MSPYGFTKPQGVKGKLNTRNHILSLLDYWSSLLCYVYTPLNWTDTCSMRSPSSEQLLIENNIWCQNLIKYRNNLKECQFWCCPDNIFRHISDSTSIIIIWNVLLEKHYDGWFGRRYSAGQFGPLKSLAVSWNLISNHKGCNNFIIDRNERINSIVLVCSRGPWCWSQH